MLRVILAEDSVLLREGLIGLMDRFGHTVSAAVGDAPALLDAVRRDRPDLVITDVRMPPDSTDDGLRAALSLREGDPDLPVLVLSQYVVQSYAADLLSSGNGAAVGYLLKDRIGDVTDFADAIVTVVGGGTVVDPEVVRQLFARKRDPLQRLTSRERDVLQLMAEGRSNAAIAAALYISDAAVAKHVGSILTKLDLPPAESDHRRVLAVLAYLRGATS
jgi:DNA-binding NarL/FixJ family response regulator